MTRTGSACRLRATHFERIHRAGMDSLATRMHWYYECNHHAGMDALATRTHLSQQERDHCTGMDALATRTHCCSANVILAQAWMLGPLARTGSTNIIPGMGALAWEHERDYRAGMNALANRAHG